MTKISLPEELADYIHNKLVAVLGDVSRKKDGATEIITYSSNKTDNDFLTISNVVITVGEMNDRLAARIKINAYYEGEIGSPTRIQQRYSGRETFFLDEPGSPEKLDSALLSLKDINNGMWDGNKSAYKIPYLFGPYVIKLIKDISKLGDDCGLVVRMANIVPGLPPEFTQYVASNYTLNMQTLLNPVNHIAGGGLPSLVKVCLHIDESDESETNIYAHLSSDGVNSQGVFLRVGDGQVESFDVSGTQKNLNDILLIPYGESQHLVDAGINDVVDELVSQGFVLRTQNILPFLDQHTNLIHAKFLSKKIAIGNLIFDKNDETIMINIERDFTDGNGMIKFNIVPFDDKEHREMNKKEYKHTEDNDNVISSLLIR